MSALIGILNKKGVAIAADSAITHAPFDGTAAIIYHTTTKIFGIRENIPVALMTCGHAEFMRCPVEVLFNNFCSTFPVHQCLSVRDYCSCFTEYLRSIKSFQEQDIQTDNTFFEMRNLFNKMVEKVKSFGSDENLFWSDFMDVLNDLDAAALKEERIPDFESYSFDDFWASIEPDWEEFENDVLNRQIPDDVRDAFLKLFFHILGSKDDRTLNVEIIFAGYGDDDLYPSICVMEYSGFYGNRLRYWESSYRTVSDEEPSLIIPFGQYEKMQTVLSGWDPKLRPVFAISNKICLGKMRDTIVERLRDLKASEELVSEISDIETEDIGKSFLESIDSYSKMAYNDHILQAVGTFGIAEMADVAERMISLTNLQLLITAQPQTVGGPVEVAAITNTGFRWIKHHQ